MPGIAGIITRMPSADAHVQLARMLRSMQHDPSYVSGMHCDPGVGAYCGWVAREGSFASQMPVRNECGAVTLVFAGEEFPEPGTVERLRKSHELGDGAAAYLPHLYEEDPSFPENLNGRFHGLLVDRRRKTAQLFIDRYGMQRIYWHQAEDAFYFAAEAKAILAVRPELRKLDPGGLGDFISCGCALENRTLFAGIQLLPPASVWTFRDGSLEKRGLYFEQSTWEEQETLEPEAYYQAIREVFSRNLGRYFGGCERIGVSLTGGLDSRMIMAWQSHAAGTLPCFSFGGMFRDCQDVLLARKVAEVCGQRHETIAVGKEFLASFADYAQRTIHLTDGCVGVNHAPDLFGNERAAQIAPVRMTGNYGGEVLRRVRAFKPAKQANAVFSADLVPHWRAGVEAYGRAVEGHPLSFAVFRQTAWHHYSLLSLEQTQVSLRSPFLDNEFVRTVFRAPASAVTSNDVSLRLIADGNAALGRIPTDRGLTAHGGAVEAAVNNWIEFTVKAEYAYDYGMPQWLAKTDGRLSALHLEKLFLGRHKFAHFRLWYRDALSAYVRQLLLDPRTLSRPFFVRRELERIVAEHTSGSGNHTLAIHRAISLELLHRTLLEDAA